MSDAKLTEASPTITVRVRYFAILRTTLGRSQEARSIPNGTTVGQLFDEIMGSIGQLDALRASTMLMVNQEYAEANHQLNEGDEVVFIPPVSGGSSSTDASSPAVAARTFRRFCVTPDPLDPPYVESLVAGPSAGAIVAFIGTVRDTARGQDVSQLVYEAYEPAAEKQLARLADEVQAQWGIPIEHVAVHHRVGRLDPGEASVIIAVASPHRDEAFAACRHIIERIKVVVPIWKEEHYADGAVWIGSEAAYQDLPDRRSAP